MENLSPKYLEIIDEIVKRHSDRPGPVKLMLHDVQHDLGYIPLEAMMKISAATGSSVAEVYGVVTFYSNFTLAPKGEHVINVCMGTACYVKGSQDLLEKIQKLTNSPVNGTSDDGLFSLDATRCLGACGLAPVCVIDGVVIGQAVNNPKVDEMLRNCKAKPKETLN